MKYIIIIPYYCQREIDAFLDLASIWPKLTNTNLKYEFLLSCRWDSEMSNVLEQKFSSIVPTTHIRCVTKGVGIRKSSQGSTVEGPTAMFWDTLEYINEHYSNDGGFVFWLEWDMVPVVPSWLDQLAAEWHKKGYVIMGRFIDRKWIKRNIPKRVKLDNLPRHINGGACYCKDFCTKVTRDDCNLTIPWDIDIFQYIDGHLPYRATDLIELRFWNNQTMFSYPKSKTVLLHGIKDSSVRDFVRREHFPR